MKNLLIGLLVASLLIGFFSALGTSGSALPSNGSGWPTTAGDTGPVIPGDGAEPGEAVQQTQTPQETEQQEAGKGGEPETVQEHTEGQTAANEPTGTGDKLGPDQRAICNMVAVFLAGVASVLIVEVLIYMRKEE